MRYFGIIGTNKRFLNENLNINNIVKKDIDEYSLNF